MVAQMTDFYKNRRQTILANDERNFWQIADMDDRLESEIKDSMRDVSRLKDLLKERRPLAAGRFAAQEAFDAGLSIDEILNVAVAEIDRQTSYWGVVV
jgi:hypothetical protein